MKNKNDINIKKVLLKLKPFPIVNYDNFDLDRLVVYAIYILEEKKVSLYFDFIAVSLFRFFPKKFSMANFTQYPDTNRISKAVRRLTDQKRKRWATGNIENGFHLTDLGYEIAKQVSNILQNPELGKGRKLFVVQKSRGRSSMNDVQEIRESDVFKKWQNNQDINNYEFFDFLKATSYTPKQLLVEHLKQLKISVATVKAREIIKFLSFLENKFKNLLE